MQDDLATASVLQHLEWTVIKRLDGLLQGDYRSLFRGFGLDLADLREYQANDDVRFIDWNVTARMNSPYVREFQEDREITCWFLVDLSASLNFGSQLQTKRALAARLVGVLARVLTRHGNQVGAALYSQRTLDEAAGEHAARNTMNRLDRVIPPRHGRTQVLNLMDGILRPGPGPDTSGSAKARDRFQDITHLSLMIEASRAALKRRSVVVVISDFISTTGWEKALALLGQRHEVLAMRLHDPLERRLPDMGMITLTDPETGEQLRINSSDKALRQRFADLADQRERDITQAMLDAGIDNLAISTTDDLADALVGLTHTRKQRRRHA